MPLRHMNLKIDLEATSKAANDEKAQFFSKTNSLLTNIAMANTSGSPSLQATSMPGSAFGSRSQQPSGLLSAVVSADSPSIGSKGMAEGTSLSGLRRVNSSSTRGAASLMGLLPSLVNGPNGGSGHCSPRRDSSPYVPHLAALANAKPHDADNRDVEYNNVSGKHHQQYHHRHYRPDPNLLASPTAGSSSLHIGKAAQGSDFPESTGSSTDASAYFDQFFFLPNGDVAFTELAVIGKGSGGSVRKAQHKVTGELFAIKEIHCHNVAQLDQTKREIQSLFGGAVGGIMMELSRTQVFDGKATAANHTASGTVEDDSPKQPLQTASNSEMFVSVDTKDADTNRGYLSTLLQQQVSQNSNSNNLFTSVLAANTSSLRPVSATTAVDSQSSSNTTRLTGDISTTTGGTGSLVALTDLAAADPALTASALIRHAHNNPHTPDGSLFSFEPVCALASQSAAMPPSLHPLGSSSGEQTASRSEADGKAGGNSRRVSWSSVRAAVSGQVEGTNETLGIQSNVAGVPTLAGKHQDRDEAFYRSQLDSLSWNVAPLRPDDTRHSSDSYVGRSEDGVPLHRIDGSSSKTFSATNPLPEEPIMMPDSFVGPPVAAISSSKDHVDPGLGADNRSLDNPFHTPHQANTLLLSEHRSSTQDTLRSSFLGGLSIGNEPASALAALAGYGTWSESFMTPTSALTMVRPPLGNKGALSQQLLPHARAMFGDDDSFFTNTTQSSNNHATVSSSPSAKRFSGSGLTTNASNSTVGVSHGLLRTPPRQYGEHHAHFAAEVVASDDHHHQHADDSVRLQHHVDPIITPKTHAASSQVSTSTNATNVAATSLALPTALRSRESDSGEESDNAVEENEALDNTGQRQKSFAPDADGAEAVALAAAAESSVILNPLFVTSPYIVRSYGVTVHDQSVLVAMELLDGSLDNVRKATRAASGIPDPILASFAFDILSGLDYLHADRHIVHRDVKPLNLLYCMKTGFVKIADFGICTSVGGGEVGTTPKAGSALASSSSPTNHDRNSFVGTVSYMSPERLLGRTYSTGCDVWSAGITLLELAIGSHPFQHYFLQSKLQRLQNRPPGTSSSATTSFAGDVNFIGSEPNSTTRLGVSPSSTAEGGPPTSLGSSMIGSPPGESSHTYSPSAPVRTPVISSHMSVEAKFWVLLKHLNTADPVDVSDLFAKGRPAASGLAVTTSTYGSLPVFSPSVGHQTPLGGSQNIHAGTSNPLVPNSPVNLKTLSFGMDFAWTSQPPSRAVSVVGVRSAEPSSANFTLPSIHAPSAYHHQSAISNPVQKNNNNATSNSVPIAAAPFHFSLAESTGTPANRSTTALHATIANSESAENDNDAAYGTRTAHAVGDIEVSSDPIPNNRFNGQPMNAHQGVGVAYFMNAHDSSSEPMLIRGSGKDPEEGVEEPSPIPTSASATKPPRSLLILPATKHEDHFPLPFSSTDSQNLNNTLRSEHRLSATNSGSKLAVAAPKRGSDTHLQSYEVSYGGHSVEPGGHTHHSLNSHHPSSAAHPMANQHQLYPLSEDFKSFASLCLEKDPLKRPTAAQLLEHPFMSLRATHEEVAQFLVGILRPATDITTAGKSDGHSRENITHKLDNNTDSNNNASVQLVNGNHFVSIAML